MLRDATSSDFDAILALNNEAVRFTSPLDEAGLARLHPQAAYHRVVELDSEAAAFLLALREGLDYASPNYRWFASTYETFLYIDRIVVSARYQRRGLGKLLYDDLFAFARQREIRQVVCEFNVYPLNESSLGFHRAFDFEEVGTQWIAGGAKQVSLQRSFV